MINQNQNAEKKPKNTTGGDHIEVVTSISKKYSHVLKSLIFFKNTQKLL